MEIECESFVFAISTLNSKMLRKTIFWLHLSCGLTASLVVLLMSVTGVILSYERQIQVWEDRSYYAEPLPEQQALTVDQLIAAGRDINGFEPTTVLINSDETAPAVLRQGRGPTYYLNPYTAQLYPPHSDRLSQFFANVRGWHRWFNLSAERRSTGKAITGAANLMFLFLVLSGIYLWLPKVFSWATVRMRLLFTKNTDNPTARNFNWHHVFGIWAAIPLIVIISTATVFNYRWANNLVYRLAGEEPPVRSTVNTDDALQAQSLTLVPLNDLIVTATGYSDSWRTLSLAIPDEYATTASITIDEGDGGQPQKRHTITLDTTSAEVISWAPFTSQSAGLQARRWMRFLHTGEAFGLIGQTAAGLASMAGVFMVWTGLSLVFRRFSRWRSRQRRSPQIEVQAA